MLKILDSLFDASGRLVYRCRCDCGKEPFVRRDYMIQGKKSSCGCESVKRLIGTSTKHGWTILSYRSEDPQKTTTGNSIFTLSCKECGKTGEVSGYEISSKKPCDHGIDVRIKDMAGKKFDSLTVVRLHPEPLPGTRNAGWVCRCDCGKEIIKASNALRRKKRPYLSCGCKRDNRTDFTGKKIGFLTVSGFNSFSQKWIVDCECGNSIEVKGGRLSNMVSCGCKNALDLTGERFGKLVAQKAVGSSREGKLWLCECDCGGSKVTSVLRLRRGLNKTCGCSGRKHNYRWSV